MKNFDRRTMKAMDKLEWGLDLDTAREIAIVEPLLITNEGEPLFIFMLENDFYLLQNCGVMGNAKPSDPDVITMVALDHYDQLFARYQQHAEEQVRNLPEP